MFDRIKNKGTNRVAYYMVESEQGIMTRGVQLESGEDKQRALVNDSVNLSE